MRRKEVERLKREAGIECRKGRRFRKERESREQVRKVLGECRWSRNKRGEENGI